VVSRTEWLAALMIGSAASRMPRTSVSGDRMNSQAVNGAVHTGDYLHRHGESGYRAFNLDVPRVEGGLVVKVTALPPDLFGAVDLPPAL